MKLDDPFPLKASRLGFARQRRHVVFWIRAMSFARARGRAARSREQQAAPLPRERGGHQQALLRLLPGGREVQGATKERFGSTTGRGGGPGLYLEPRSRSGFESSVRRRDESLRRWVELSRPSDGRGQRTEPLAAICVQSVDVQCVLQFTLVHAAGCVLHRRTSRVIHRLKLCHRFGFRSSPERAPLVPTRRGFAGRTRGCSPLYSFACRQQKLR